MRAAVPRARTNTQVTTPSRLLAAATDAPASRATTTQGHSQLDFQNRTVISYRRRRARASLTRHIRVSEGLGARSGAPPSAVRPALNVAAFTVAARAHTHGGRCTSLPAQSHVLLGAFVFRYLSDRRPFPHSAGALFSFARFHPSLHGRCAGWAYVEREG